MRADAEAYFTTHRGIARLWLGILLPPGAWLVHLSASYALSPAVCDRALPYHLVTLGALAIALTGGWLAWRNHRDTGGAPNPDEPGTLARSRFMSTAGLASAAFFVLAILFAEVPNWVVPPCAP
jgi:hypothetical protein